MSPNNAFVDGGAAGAAAAPKISTPPPESKEVFRSCKVFLQRWGFSADFVSTRLKCYSTFVTQIYANNKTIIKFTGKWDY